MNREAIVYSGGGLALHGHFVRNSETAEPRPGAWIFPEASGLNDHAREKADRLASEAGHVVFAADIHGGQRGTDGLDEAMVRVGVRCPDRGAKKFGRAGSAADHPQAHARSRAEVRTLFADALDTEIE